VPERFTPSARYKPAFQSYYARSFCLRVSGVVAPSAPIKLVSPV